VFVGDTLATRTEVVGLKQNRPRSDGTASGLVALRIRTTNQREEPVLDFWRCPMIPLRDPDASTGHADRFEDIPTELDPGAVEGAVPSGWRYDALRIVAGGTPTEALEPGSVFEIEGRDTVTAAPELARLTLNVARAHTDAGGSLHGRRLVYGGHTISVAAAHATRALPGLATIVAWRSCTRGRCSRGTSSAPSSRSRGCGPSTTWMRASSTFARSSAPTARGRTSRSRSSIGGSWASCRRS
jgi:2-methylfumaryl-CoA hydratase